MATKTVLELDSEQSAILDSALAREWDRLDAVNRSSLRVIGFVLRQRQMEIIEDLMMRCK